MRSFSYQRATDAGGAVRAIGALPATKLPAAHAPGQFIAGGTNLTDYMKLGVTSPELLVDINALAKAGYGGIDVTAAGIRFGALARMADVQDHPAVQRDYPVIAETLVLAASQQIRNMASLGGNVLQRTRCEYFRGTCNRRQPGSGCAALGGISREHAILGASDSCIATYPGDLAQALIALDARVEILGTRGKRTVAFADLHRLPGRTPHIETALEPGELITFIHVPAGPHARRSHYVKVRDRQSYQFALASAAVALDLHRDVVRDVRIALGGVATIPWRARQAEAALRGKVLDEDTARAAAKLSLTSAKTSQHNAFKRTAAEEVIVRALMETKAMQV